MRTTDMSNNPLGIHRVHHISWTVADIDAVVDFYGRVFGARILYRVDSIDAGQLPRGPDGRDWTETHLGIPDAHLRLAMLELPDGTGLELFEYLRPASQATAPLPSNHVGSHHLGIQVKSIEAASRILLDNGCRMLEKIIPPDEDSSGTQFRYFMDPWKNIFELVEIANENLL